MLIDCERYSYMTLDVWWKKIVMCLKCAHPLDPSVKEIYNKFYGKYRSKFQENWTSLSDTMCYQMIADINPNYLKYRHIKR